MRLLNPTLEIKLFLTTRRYLMNTRHNAQTDPPDTFRNVLVSDGYDFAVGWYSGGHWGASSEILEAKNYDGGAHISLSDPPLYWFELPILEKE